MLIAIKNPGEPLAFKVVPEITLEMLQAHVLGYIETCSTKAMKNKGIIMIINEEGKLRGMPTNFWVRGDVIVGPVVFVSCKGDDFGPLSEEQVKHLNEQFVDQKLYKEGWQEVR